MQRSLVAAALLMGLMAAAAAASTDEATAYLGELVPWLMISASSPHVDVRLDSVSEEALEWSFLADRIGFGTLPIGFGEDSAVTFAAMENGVAAPLLIIDTDNDESLDNEAWMTFDRRYDVHYYKWFATVDASFGTGTGIVTVPYHIAIYADYSFETAQYEYTYVGLGHRKGILAVGDSLYAIAVATPESTGRYDDVSKLIIAVDINRDGHIDTLPYSAEAFAPGEIIHLPEGAYEPVSSSVDGRYLTLRRVGETALRPIIAPGELAPAFSAAAHDGSLVEIPDKESRVTVLCFTPDIFSSGSCEQCAATELREWIEKLLRLVASQGPGVRLIVVSYEPVREDFELDLGSILGREGNEHPRLSIQFVHDRAINELYRRSEWTLLISRDGLIAAMDESWSTFEQGREYGGTHRLSISEIGSVVARLRRAQTENDGGG